ncbi:MAG: HAD family hydrolase [Luteimonas sp.]
MSLDGIRALTFDTGGTLLDWHSGFRDALAAAGRRHNIERDWPALANELRRRSLAAMLNLGKESPPTHNFDQAHRFTLNALLADEGLEVFDETDRRDIAWEAPHRFNCWTDVPIGLSRLRRAYVVASLTILSYRIVIDTARHNGLSWDAVLSCEGMGVYKPLPQAYAEAARRLQFEPCQCLMVACHPFDLDAAQAVGFRTALVRRPAEWGAAPPPHATSEDRYELVVDDLTALARSLHC